MPALWTCPTCRRVFRRPKQTHSCDLGSREAMVAGRPDALVQLYVTLEDRVRAWDGVEIVYARRTALFRTTRIFADLVFMTDALRLALLLDHEAKDPIFVDSGRMSTNRVAHVTKIRTAAQLRVAMPYLREAHGFALRDAGAKKTAAARRR